MIWFLPVYGHGFTITIFKWQWLNPLTHCMNFEGLYDCLSHLYGPLNLIALVAIKKWFPKVKHLFKASARLFSWTKLWCHPDTKLHVSLSSTCPLIDNVCVGGGGRCGGGICVLLSLNKDINQKKYQFNSGNTNVAILLWFSSLGIIYRFI